MIRAVRAESSLAEASLVVSCSILQREEEGIRALPRKMLVLGHFDMFIWIRYNRKGLDMQTRVVISAYIRFRSAVVPRGRWCNGFLWYNPSSLSTISRVGCVKILALATCMSSITHLGVSLSPLRTLQARGVTTQKVYRIRDIHTSSGVATVNDGSTFLISRPYFTCHSSSDFLEKRHKVDK